MNIYPALAAKGKRARSAARQKSVKQQEKSTTMLKNSTWITVAILVCWTSSVNRAVSHEMGGHEGPTYRVAPPRSFAEGEPCLQLSILDAETGRPTPARFSIVVDGETYTPDQLGPGGIVFETIHTSKRQRFKALYSRGTGPVQVPLPPGARSGSVIVVKGFDYRVVSVDFQQVGGNASLQVELSRWNDLHRKGWISADAHLHYERHAKQYDRDWLTLLAAEGLDQGHFMMVLGGNLPGIWAEQYAYGSEGEATDGHRLLTAGEEYRDSLQGHINLLGLGKIIHPILAGTRKHPHHYPTFLHILQKARSTGGFVGPAHGAKLGRSPTAVADTVLGAVDFFEIANTHLLEPDLWYQLMNCGYLVPPSAGTDLPNYPFREAWQPLLGETRIVVQVDDRRDFSDWTEAVRQGRVFTTSGPTISLTVNDAGLGETVQLPPKGGTVTVTAELAGPRPLRSLEVLLSGKPIEARTEDIGQDGIARHRLTATVPIKRSTWLAARGFGVRKKALSKGSQIEQTTHAHTAAIPVLVGDQPIWSPDDARQLRERLAKQKALYLARGNYEQESHREEMLDIFDRAIRELEEPGR